MMSPKTSRVAAALLDDPLRSTEAVESAETSLPVSEPTDALHPGPPSLSSSDLRLPLRASELPAKGYKAGGRPRAEEATASPTVRLTVYLTQDQIMVLRHEVLKRQTQGRRADVSSLIREAIGRTFPRSR
jgi:hypothetical protein